MYLFVSHLNVFFCCFCSALSVRVTGTNFGRDTDARTDNWTEYERVVALYVDDFIASNAQRVQLGSLSVIDGTIPLIPVGPHNLSISVAGQNTTLLWSDPVSTLPFIIFYYLDQLDSLCLHFPS